MKPLLALLAILGLSAVFVPAPYEALAEASLEPLGVLDRAREMDADFARVTELPGGLLDLARDFLGRPAPEALPAGAGGFFEGNLARLLVPIVAAFLRVAVLVLSLAGLLVVLALSYAGRAVAEVRALRASQAELQARVARLEVGAAPRPEGP